MTDWIFRGNREDFDIDQYLRDFDYIYWAVKHKKHQDEMQIGDRVFIWRSKGKSKAPYGLVAFGRIVEPPVSKHNVIYPEFLLEEYWTKREVSEIKVGIKLQSVRLSLDAGMVESGLLSRDKELAQMQLLTARQGTNFRLTTEQFNRIWTLWVGDDSNADVREGQTDSRKTREQIYANLKGKMERAGFVFEKEQTPYFQDEREKELKFVHPELQRKFEGLKIANRARKYYIKPLADDQNSEVGFTTGKTSPLFRGELFPQPNSSDTYKNPNNELNAWVNRPNDNTLDRLLAEIKNYLSPTEDEVHNYLTVEIIQSSKLSSAQRLKRLRHADKKPASISVKATAFKRNPDVVAEVLFQAKGECGDCHKDAPFIRKSDGTPYLEVHHKIPLSQGGDDTVENAIALCPNCHRKRHYG